MIGRRSADRNGQAPRLSMAARLKPLLGDRRGAVAGLAVSSLVSGFAEAGMLALIAEAAAQLVSSSKQTHIHLGSLHLSVEFHTLIAIAFGLGVVRLLMQIPLSVLPARIASDVQARMRTDLFHAFTGASWEAQSRDREGQLQDTMTSQTMQATGGAVGATNLIVNSLNFLALLVTAFLLNAIAAAAILCAGVIMFVALRPVKQIGVRRARALSKAQVRYASGINEAVRVAEETQVFGVAAAQRNRIDVLVRRAQKLFFQAQLIAKLVPNLFQSLVYILIVVGLAVVQGIHGNHAALGAIVLILVRSTRSGQQVWATYQGLAQTIPFIERTQEAQQRYANSSPPEGEVPLQTVNDLAFRDVSYAYRPDRPVLSDISFEVRRGEVVGIIGPTGAGKSTLIQILLQLRRPQQGQYLVNGMPADQIVRGDWHTRVVYVPQEPRLLHASVAENIRFERDELDDDAVQQAARLAHIHDEIMAWPKGYETIVGPRADAVSGGQKQRICLARALVAKPEVLVLDEPTSALDPNSESLIQESLTALRHELTMFIIAHRMSTLDICDRVMVIKDGRLAAFDTIDLLKQHNDYYRSASAFAAGASAGSQL